MRGLSSYLSPGASTLSHQAQADQQAEAMRKKLEEKRQQREVAVSAMAGGQEVRRAWVDPVRKEEKAGGQEVRRAWVEEKAGGQEVRRAWVDPYKEEEEKARGQREPEVKPTEKAGVQRAWMEPDPKENEKVGEQGEQEVRMAWVDPAEKAGDRRAWVDPDSKIQQEVRKHWGEPVSETVAIAKQCDATGIVRDETSSNIVFEHPGITPAASKGEATPPGDARKLWGAEEGVPLVAMLQEKTLQTATYAVQKSATQNVAGETKIVFSKFADLATEGSGETVTGAQLEGVAVSPPNLGGDATSPPTGDSPSPKKGVISASPESPTACVGSTESSAKSSPPTVAKSTDVNSSLSASPKGAKSSPSASPRGAKSSPSASPKDVPPKTPLPDEKQSPVQPPAVKTPTAAAVKQAWTKDDGDSVPMGNEGGASGRHEKLVEGIGGGVSAEGKSSGEDLVTQGEDMTVEDIETLGLTASKEPVLQLTAEEVFSTPGAPEQDISSRFGVDPDSFHTPSAEDKVMMSASLRAGTYDAGVSILRTCSLPDLMSIVAAVDPSDSGVRVGGHHGSPETGGNVPEDSGAPEMEGRNRDTEPHDKDDEDVFYEDAVASEEGEKGGTSEEEGKEEEEEWSSSEDEDLQQLVQTLQNFVADAKSPVNTKSMPRTSSSPPPPLAEDWEDSDEEIVLSQGGGDGRGKVKVDPQEGSSVFNRLETTRTMLETELGLTAMLQAYQLIQTFYEDGPEAVASEGGGSNEEAGLGGDSARVFPMEKLVTIVGGEKPQVCKTLIHLVMADSAYVETTEREVEDTDLWLEEVEENSEPCSSMETVALAED